MNRPWPRKCLLIFLLGFSSTLIPSARAIHREQQSDIESIFRRMKQDAIERSFDIQIANQTVTQKSSRLYTSWTHWLPRLDLQLSQSRSKNFSFLTSGALGNLSGTLEPQALSLARWDLNLTFPIYRRAIQLGIQQSSAERELAQEQAHLKQTELDWKLRAALGNYLLASYRIATVGNTIEVAKSNLREAKLRFELGQRTKVDVLRSESNLMALESQKLSYQEQQTSEQDRLLESTGLSRTDLRELGLEDSLRTESEISIAIERFTQINEQIQAIEPFLGQDPKTTERLQTQITASSPLYRTYMTEEELSAIRARNGVAQEWPELLLQGSLNKQTPEWNTVFSGGSQSYSVSLALNIPLFSGGSLISGNLEKWSTQEIASLKRQQDSLRFRNEVEAERIRIQSLAKSLEAQTLNVAQNEQILQLSRKSYQLGKGTMVELLDAQNTLIHSKIDLAKTKVDLSNLVRQFAWNIGAQLP